MLVGRAAQTEILDEALASPEAELVAIYGRRRVGKTYLIRQHYADAIAFELTGMHGASLGVQLRNFGEALAAARGESEPAAPPRDWMAAFSELRRFLGEDTGRRPRVVFLDEVPWLASRKSGFLSAFEHFWNSFASRHPRLVVVLCGSAASWMLRHVVRARGGLHHRVTRRIRLLPFTLAETRDYLRSRGVDIGLYQTLELYMALGGIPHYLKEVRRGESAAAAIDRLCFGADGLLVDEFRLVYASLFRGSERHEALVRALASKPGGRTRTELAEQAGVPSGGTLTRTLEDLQASGFVAQTPRFGGKRRDAPYRLVDPYSLFYLRWIQPRSVRARGAWHSTRGTPAWRAWAGYAFESVCLEHVDALERALGIEGVETAATSWSYRGDDTWPGAQIDLVIDRRDATINLCELKFSENPFTIDKAYADTLRRKRAVFAGVTRTRKTLMLVFVTTYGVTPNAYASELVARSIEMDALFRD